MRKPDLDRIERELQVHLPKAYRDTLETYPFPVDDHSVGMWLVDDADDVISSTHSWRDAQPNSLPWPATLVYIGSDGGEYAYFLDVSRDPAPVMVYDHETGTVLGEEAPNLPSFVEKCRRDLEEIEADKRAMKARFRNKKWWEFWIRPYPSRDAT
jgi:hypothetical protein